MKQSSFFQIKTSIVLLLFVTVLLLPSASAAFGNEEDREKPKPAFTRQDDIITTKLTPRAKSNSITIDFQAAGGGTLSAVNAFDINKAMSPQINPKDFRSDLFRIDLEGVTPGGEATLAVSSAFFTTSTYFWIFNERLPTPWMNSKAENISMGNKVQKFMIRIQDGGPFDSDGAADGKISVIGGPLDSFWGYVLGTLFIRFFGVFIVLGVLMIGMLLSGQVFQALEKKKEEVQPDMPLDITPPTPAPAPVDDLPPARPFADAVTPEMAAAIGAALAMHQAPSRMMPAPSPARETVHETVQAAAPSWAMDGRRQIMSDRSMVFNRVK